MIDNLPQKHSKKHSLHIVFLCIVFLGSGFSLPLIHRYLKESEAFKIKNILISSQSEHVKNGEIEAFLQNYKGKSLYSVNLDEIRQKAKQHPWIKTVSVRRLPPHELQIQFLEHKPLALVSLDQLYLVDEEGELFKPINKNDTFNLPIITGLHKQSFINNRDETQEKIKTAILALREHTLVNHPGGSISEINISNQANINTHLITGIKITLGKYEFQKKWMKLKQILTLLEDKKKILEFAYLDDYPHTHQVAIKIKNL